MTVAVLFARRDSVYKTLGGCDVFDADRDARTWPGGAPVVAHPPCRSWGRLRTFAKPAPGERENALWAVDEVRRWGGVLEHPASSTLWPAAGMARPGDGADAWGGWTLDVDQVWWGHGARKRTWLYVVGVRPRSVSVPMAFVQPRYRIGENGEGARVNREHTPRDLAVWLVDLAARCDVPAFA